ncbi:MAG: SDR family NAD(P)-dependent oxidoreductase [Segniliparus sp.]|uniref:SDR family NAD(P)-dependent oxidoreductase n=1 Tax=Segniliparus sp. TaxID=2804064 RepID=UPI003F3C3124
MPIPNPDPSRPAVVTGASGGIGKAIAFELAKLGHPVLLVARRADQLDEIAGQIRSRHNVDARTFPVDLADRDARQKLIDHLADVDVSILVANAGVATLGRWEDELDYAKERAEVELNVIAAYETTLAVLPKMLARRSGGIILTGSLAGNGPGPRNTTYAATKAFVNTFSESLHFDVKPQGVNVTLLAPGPVRTEIFAELPHAAKAIPNFVWGEAEHTARATVAGLAKNKLRVVPAFPHKVAGALSALVPRRLYGWSLDKAYGAL